MMIFNKINVFRLIIQAIFHFADIFKLVVEKVAKHVNTDTKLHF